MNAHRPDTLIGVVGTDTEVGKTWVSAQLLSELRNRQITVAGRKPVQSFDAGDTTTDAAVLAAATGEPELEVCPIDRRYPCAMAPPMAADLLGKLRIELADLVAEIVWPANVAVGLVETVGGILSPLSHDGDSLDLLKRLRPDLLLLVADAGLGTINSVRLGLMCLQTDATLVFLNRYDPCNELHRRNRLCLAERFGIETIVTIENLAEIIVQRSGSQT